MLDENAESDQGLTFRFEGRSYRGASALEVIFAMDRDAEPPHPRSVESLRSFLRWSVGRVANRLPPRDLDLSDRLEDEALALSYLSLLDEYGLGELSVGPQSQG